MGRAGDALPTQHTLSFQYAHALARDAVAAQADFGALAAALAPRPSVRVRSAAPDRSTYLRRPDLGRRLAPGEASLLPTGPYDAVFVIADGLSAGAVQLHAVPLIEATQRHLDGWNWGPVVLAAQARVALGDEVGARMNATLVAVMIGERPGLTVPNSLGIYLTYGPRIGRSDAERNCISNVHADGLSYGAAAAKLAWLLSEARVRRLTGVSLKEAAPVAAALDATVPGDPPPPQKALDSATADLRCSPRTNTQGDDR